eukprot:TRINITY_DN11303_c0_g1_i1.p1 TRINITY_DN11303_c0_g1~~TRINITY_DN11303_c0_g1_i1.p1  ORF type:complete len:350 (-),score=41.13 TRINITY_DN11303_c0_g1_i1:99-1127(-)
MVASGWSRRCCEIAVYFALLSGVQVAAEVGSSSHSAGAPRGATRRWHVDHPPTGSSSSSSKTVTAVQNLAHNRIPFGASETYGAGLTSATDGDLQSQWRSSPDAHLQRRTTAWLLVDLGAPCRIDGMRIYGGSLSGGFKTLKTYRSLDGLSWYLVRLEGGSNISEVHCGTGKVSEHDGWTEETRYVMIQMANRCVDIHSGSFGLAEWEVLGWPVVDMVPKYAKSWPHCTNLGECFSLDLSQAKSACLADPDCDGFSFSAGSMNGGRGAGCYKTMCQGKDDRDTGNSSSDKSTGQFQVFGRGSHGYWEKRRTMPPPVEVRLPEIVEVIQQLYVNEMGAEWSKS